jgi:FkbM family methyltransferase
MIKNLSYLIYLIIIACDKIIKLVKNTSLVSAVYDQIRNNSYIDLTLNKRKLSFFTPTLITKQRIETYFIKEPETLKWINSFEKNCIFWDIGSNIGQYAIYAATKHKKINIFAFEPSPSNLVVLSRNISINHLSNKISIIPFGLINKKNSFLFMNESKFEEGSAMHDLKKNQTSKLEYKIYGTSIKNLIENKTLKIPNYIKIDVDGAELDVLEGFGSILNNSNIKSLFIELDLSDKKKFDNCFKIIKKFKFKLITKNRSELYKHSTLTTYNYIFERK